MAEPAAKSSICEVAGTIRHLDASRARQLVDTFRKPVVADGAGLSRHVDDPVIEEAWGCVTLHRAAIHDARPDVVAYAKTHLHLHGLLRLPLSVARELLEHRGHIYLDRLPSITDSVAATLAGHVGGALSLDGLRTISESAARALGRHAGELSLNAVTHLGEAAARSLAHHAHDLHLDGIVLLGPKAAAALAGHRGNLHLNGIAVLAGRAARHLACHAGQLHLHGISVLSNDAAAAFGQRAGHLCLQRLSRLTPLQAEALVGHRGELQIPAVRVDDAVAECLGRHQGSLLIHVPADLPLHRLEALVRHQGPLEISGLARLDERRARVLAAQPGPRSIHGLSCLFIDGVTRLSPAVSSILATHTAGGLALNDLTDLTEDVARELVKHPMLSLDRLAGVSDRVAAILATHGGAVLSLRGLKEASPKAIARLKATTSIELSRRYYAEDESRRDALTSPVAVGHPSRQELVWLLEQVARDGEEALRKSVPSSDESP